MTCKKSGYLTLPAITILLSAWFTAYPGHAAELDRTVPVIGIIIDDIGYRVREDLRAISIPGSIAYAIMPHSPHARAMSELALKNGKIVLVHLPMEAIIKEKNRFLGPGALILDMTRDQFVNTLQSNLRSLPEAVGVNNHMGSLLTQHPGHMKWLMDILNQNSKFYIDSVTSRESVASDIAREKNVPYLRRDVFLDNIKEVPYIQAQLQELIRVAKRRGSAIGIGHPHPETIQVLTSELQHVENYGVRLVSLEELVKPRARGFAHTMSLSN